jgi:Fic family protein
MTTDTDGRWPAIEYEERPWVSSVEPGAVSRRQALRARGPYRAAIPPMIARLSLPVPSATAVEAHDATAAIVRFDAEVGAVAAPFSAILLRTESASSSEIENLTSGARAIALAEVSRGETPNSRLIVSNVRAMETALALSDELDVGAVISMQRVLLEASRPELTGEFRREQVWIGGSGSSPHGADFVPPHAERVSALMEDAMEFARRTDLPVLQQVAVAHAQFETVHPFADGNGRTGRALVQAMLRAHALTRNVTVPVSAGLLTDTARYFRALDSYRDGDIVPIVQCFSDAAFSAVDNGRRLVADLTAVADGWRDAASARAGSAGRRLLDVLQRQPVINTAAAVSALGVAPLNAQAGIDRLVGDGILRQIGSASRNRYWEAPEVLDALDAFAARAKRGGPRH